MQEQYREGVHAAMHAMLNVLPLHVICGEGDVGAECDNPYSARFRPDRLLLFDRCPGGIGLAYRVTHFPTALKDAVHPCCWGNSRFALVSVDKQCSLFPASFSGEWRWQGWSSRVAPPPLSTQMIFTGSLGWGETAMACP